MSFTTIFSRREHRSPEVMRDKMWSVANLITFARGFAAFVFITIAIRADSRGWLLAMVGISMVADICDGVIARLRCEETIFGAQLDMLIDRFNVTLVAAGNVFIAGGALVTVVAAFVLWIQFGVVGLLLSIQFLRYDLWSPDEFHLIDDRVWRVNWSAVAKVSSNIPVLLLCLGGWCQWLAIGMSISLFCMQGNSYRYLRDRSLPGMHRGNA